MNPLISIIVPVYKVEQYLDECVQSIRNQTYTNLEIILVDDGSPDRCPEICDEYARQDSRIKVIHKPNGGLSSARNAGLDIATGEYVGFVDSDDYIALDMYEKLYHAFEGENNVFAVKCNHKRFIDGKFYPQAWGRNETTKILPSDKYLIDLVLGNETELVWDMLIKKQYLFVRFTVGKNNEDLLFNYQNGYYVEQHKLSLKLIPDELYIYRDIVGSISNNKSVFLVCVLENLQYMYQDSSQKGKKDLKDILYAKSAASLYELNILMATNEELKNKYYGEYHKKMFDYDWSLLIKQWGLRHRLGLVLALYFPQFLSLSCINKFVTKYGIAPPWK